MGYSFFFNMEYSILFSDMEIIYLRCGRKQHLAGMLRRGQFELIGVNILDGLFTMGGNKWYLQSELGGLHVFSMISGICTYLQ